MQIDSICSKMSKDISFGMHILYYSIIHYLTLTFLWRSFESVGRSFRAPVDIIGDGLRDTVRCCLIDRVKSPGTERVILGLWNFPVIVRMLGLCTVCRVHPPTVNTRRVHRVRGTYPQIVQDVGARILSARSCVKPKNFMYCKRRPLCRVRKNVHLRVVAGVHIPIMVLEPHHCLGIIAQKGIHCHYKNRRSSSESSKESL